MPTYDYHCKECGNRFEYFQAMSDKHLDTCPKCGGRVKRLVGGGSGLIFKGSGFYLTDYKNKSNSSGKKTIEKKETVKAPAKESSLKTKD